MKKKNEEQIYPIIPEIEEKIKKKNPLIKWDDLLLNKFGKNLRNNYLIKSNNFEFSRFIKAMNYEYGLNNTKINLNKAYKIYKKNADFSSDSLSMYKMYQIHLYESEKFNIKRNKNLENYYLYKCYAYSPFRALKNYINYMGKIELFRNISYHIQIEDSDLKKFDCLMNYMKIYGNEYKILNSDINLINAIINIQFKNKEKEGISILNTLMIQNNKEAIYKLACFEISIDKNIARNLFELLYCFNYYKSFFDYGKFLIESFGEYEKGINIFKEGFENGNYLCYFGFYDAFLNYNNLSFFEGGKNINYLLILFNCLINDITTGGIYSFLEFFFLKKIILKHFNVNKEFFKEFDIYIDEIHDFLEKIITSEKKDFLNNNFPKNSIIEFNLVYGFIYYLKENLEKSLFYIKYAYKITDNHSYRRLCYSFIFKIRKKLFKHKKISEEKMEKTNKKIFYIFNLPFKKGNLSDFSSSFFYFLAKLHYNGIGTKKNNLLSYVYFYQAANQIKKNLCSGSIITYYRQYKSNKILENETFKNLNNILNMKISDDNNEDLICSICYFNNKNTFFIPCRHMFCEECIKKINREKCPICRGNIIQIIYLK